MTAHVSEKKKEELALIMGLIEEYPVFGIVDMTDLPSVQLQRLRARLRDNLLLRLTKKRLIRFALEQLKEKKKNIEKLEGALTNCMPALIFTKESPFKLSKILGQNKSSAPARAGQTASKDIIIPAGPTKFTPGPVIGELGQLGIKTSVEGGKIAIKEDILLVKGGESISDKAADILLKLGIEPMEIGLNLISLYEQGVVYGKDVLTIDEAKYISDIKVASNEAFTLAVSCGYLTKETTPLVIKKACIYAKALAKKLNFTTSEDIKGDIIKAERDILALKNKIPDSEIETEEKVESKEVQPEETEEKVESKEPASEKTKEKIISEEAETKKTEEKEIEEVKEIVQELTDKKIKDEESKKIKESQKVPSAFELAEKKKKEKK